MFDDKQPLTPNNNQPGGNLPNTVAPPPFKEKEKELSPAEEAVSAAKEPEDIFKSTDQPQPKPAISSMSIEPENGEQADEPVIKNTPSIFTPKNQADDSIPLVDQFEPKKVSKNVILFISIFLIVVIFAVATYWWFFLKSGTDTTSSDTTPNPTLLEAYNQMQNNETPANNNNEEPVTVSPASEPKDTDGDGLTDEEEMMLGTSISSSDSDNDQLFDREEVKVYKTDPLKADTDNDGVNDKEEIDSGTDPLVVDNKQGYYTNNDLKFEFKLPDRMVLESATSRTVQFNDNIAQVKFYIYINQNMSDSITPDTIYAVTEDTSNKLIIVSSQDFPDQTSYSTDLSTSYYTSNNGNSYLIRYVATKRAPDHADKFQSILTSFEFLK